VKSKLSENQKCLICCELDSTFSKFWLSLSAGGGINCFQAFDLTLGVGTSVAKKYQETTLERKSVLGENNSQEVFKNEIAGL